MTGGSASAPDVDYLERAFDHSKYGRYSTGAVHRAHDSVAARSGPGADRRARAVRLRAVRAYALRDSRWDDERDGLAAVTIDTIERHAPGLRSLIVAQQVITPLDLERTYGLTGGHIFHGELALDQMLTMRPLLGWGHYRTPIRDLFLCSSGTHPGTGLTGGSGANAAREALRELR